MVIAILATVLFMNGQSMGIKADTSLAMDYENSIFDDSYVHSIDIEISDWDSFLETATSEEYTSVNVTIDGEKLKNVALRAKGNTSLSTVSQLGSSRYSLKLEFDRYESSNTYHGLDKLCLNNLIQDYTMMKDYIAYKLMNEFGVASPLVSYVYVTVNGEDWGLFLAVEAVEDSFLERNYGTSYGDLYKPDSMSMGGGRGNGREFDMKDMDFDEMGIPNPFENSDDNKEGSSDSSSESDSSGDSSSNSNSSGDGSSKSDNSGDGSSKSDSSGDGSSTDGFPADFSGNFPGGGFSGGGFPDGDSQDGEQSGFPGGGFPGGGGFGMGSSDAKLQYTDDDTDSYSTIFDSAKTVVSYSDKKRLISSLKSLNEGLANGDAQEISEAVDVDAVMRYMVVHNFLVNGDSYTGSMIHNYYLYEKDGKLSMIPWDYNLAYGTFQASDSSGAVNDPIDNPLSITDGDTDRPMFSWIISCDEYTQLYHEYYESFISQFYENGYLTNLIDTTYNMIKDYVEKDPTKFCEYSEFEKAVETIKGFVTLRCQSIEGQLAGTIGSTDAAQEADPDSLIDASSITLSDMGSMGGGGGPGSGGGPGNGGGTGNDAPDRDSKSANIGEHGNSSGHTKAGSHHSSSGKSNNSKKQTDTTEVSKNSDNQLNASNGSEVTDKQTEGSALPDFANAGDGNTTPDFGSFGGPNGGPGSFSNTVDPINYIYLGGCVLTLLAAIIFAKLYRNRR